MIKYTQMKDKNKEIKSDAVLNVIERRKEKKKILTFRE